MGIRNLIVCKEHQDKNGDLLCDNCENTLPKDFHFEERSIEAIASDSSVVRVEGKMPGDATVSSNEVNKDEAITLAKKYLKDISEDEVLGAYEISLTANGEKFDPKDFDNTVKVSIANAGLDMSERIAFLHVIDDETYEIVPASKLSDGALEFVAESFSTYIAIKVNAFYVYFKSTEDVEVYDTNGNKIENAAVMTDSDDFIFTVRPTKGYGITDVKVNAGYITMAGSSIGKVCNIEEVVSDVTVTITTAEVPKIMTQPITTKVAMDENAILLVEAENATKYQWQYRASDEAMWADVTTSVAAGGTTSTLTVYSNYAMNGMQFRCLVGNASIEPVFGAVSDVAAVYVVAGEVSTTGISANIVTEEAPVIIEHPATQKVDANVEKVTLTTVASGTNLSFAWQYRATSDNMWADLSTSVGTATTTKIDDTTSKSVLTVYSNYMLNGIQFRCLVSNDYYHGVDAIETDVAMLLVGTVNTEVTAQYFDLQISEQPESQKIEMGETAVFTVEAIGTGEETLNSYEWQYRKNSSEDFVAVDDTIGNGYDTATLTVNTSTMTIDEKTLKVSGDMNGYEFRCVVTNEVLPGYAATSEVATLMVAQGDISAVVEYDDTKVSSTLMERETYTYVSGTGNVYYAIGAKRAGLTNYTADKIQEITLLDSNVVPQGVVASWDASASGDGQIMAWVTKGDMSGSTQLYNLFIGGNGGIKAPAKSSNLFREYTRCVNINYLTKLDLSSVTTMESMFENCYKLTSVNLSGLVAENATKMGRMFFNCSGLTSADLSGLKTGNATDMSYLFRGCYNLKSVDLSGLETGNVTNMSYMFEVCNLLTSLDISGLDTGNVRNMSYMFSYCYSLTSINASELETSNVTNMSNMFAGCFGLTSLDVSGFETGNVTDMSEMFSSCSKLTSLDVSELETGNVTSMSSMFSYCHSLTSVDLSGLDTGKVTTMRSMFEECESLTSLDLSGLDTGNVEYMSSMFKYCASLTSLDVVNLIHQM